MEKTQNIEYRVRLRPDDLEEFIEGLDELLGKVEYVGHIDDHVVYKVSIEATDMKSDD